MQQQGGNPPYGSPPFAAFVVSSNNFDLGVAEEASPLSSRPPATTPFDGDGGNRWPKQETLALLQIRSDMDATFRDANLKGPLWEDVSRKLSEQGFKRSAKKCKEKFENVHKYYKRTKESRSGRQDGKSYRFFTQLEALHNTISTSVQPNLMSNIPISSVRAPTPLVTSSQMPQQFGVFNPTVGNNPVSFSSDSEMESSGSDEMDGEDEVDLEPDMMEAEPSNRKRKRGSSNSSGKMMEFFEGLMKQVMQKQEALQQKFLEAVEKREQDRMIREEAWKRQEIARIAREHELMVQERSISASRDAAIISFLQKITGQTIQLPTISPLVPPQQQPPPPPPPPQVSVQQPQPSSNPPTELFQKLPVQQPPHPQQQQQNTTGVLVAVPEQQVAPSEMSGGGMESATSSRWPKPEVLALIKLRSGLEPRYQEAGPKGPLWEEISSGMYGLGYKRNPKRCKEKWENINKYFKKVKESNKKRPEDAKTCPYFHELDALYRKKILGGTPPAIGGVGSSSSQLLLQQPQEQEQQEIQQQTADQIQHIIPSIPEINFPTSNGDLTATLFGEGTDSGVEGGVAKKPEDILKEQQHENRQNLTMNDFDRIDHHNDINRGQDQDDEYDDDDDDDDNDDDDGDEEAQEEMKMAYKIQFQRPNAGAGSSSNGSGSGNGTTSFLAMVQ